MRRLLSLVAATSLAVSGTAVTLAAPATAADVAMSALPAADLGTGKLWSDPATWGGAVPSTGASITIPAGTDVVLDVSPPTLSYLQIDGTLRFAEQDLTLSADAIMVHGALQVGTEAAPFTHQARIVLTGSDATKDVMGMGTKVIGVMGGTLDLHGTPRKSWTKLTAIAAKGTTTVTVADATGWRVGDKIAFASTDYDYTQAEDRTITAISGNTLTLNAALLYMHYGVVQTIDGRPLDQRGEVAQLTRNVSVEGDATSSADGFGGQVMVMPGSTGRFSNVELTRMGQLGVLRRYPIHFHMNGDAGANSYVKNTAIHHGFNRCITVHGTNKTLLQDNVCHDTFGHGFFFEDGAESGNTIEGNLGMTIRKPAAGKQLLASDMEPTAFWLTHPDNTFRNNVAAGTEGSGIWLALPEHPTGLSTTTAVWNRRIPLGVFTGNVAHSSGLDGLHVDSGPTPTGTTAVTVYAPVANQTDPSSAPVVATFANQVSYKNRDGGIWLRGKHHRVTGATLADNAKAVTFASNETFLTDSLVIGESANKGTPKGSQTLGLDGRTLPKPSIPAYPIRGFEFYDGRVGTERTTFANFTPNTQRKASGLGYQLNNLFTVNTGNYATALRFVNAERLYAPNPVAGMDGDQSALFIDIDGSVTGIAKATVVANNPFLRVATCTHRPTWNAYVCGGTYTNLVVEARDGSVAAIKPLTITRTDSITQTLFGPAASSRVATTSIRSGSRYDVNFTDVNGLITPQTSRYSLRNGAGTFATLSVDYPTAPRVLKGTCDLDLVSKSCFGKATSLSALDAATKSSYFYDATARKVHLKLVATTANETLDIAPRL